VLEFRILGPIAVLRDGDELAIPGTRARAVLAVLLVDAGRVVPADRLIDLLWSDEPPRSARNSLHVRVAGLRRALGKDRIVSRGLGYSLQVEPGELDLHRFEALLDDGSADAVAEALELWRGPPLADFANEHWAAASIARLDELHLVARERRIEAELERGEDSAVIPELEALVQEHPLRERLWGQLMLALYRCGRQVDALSAYRAARDRFVGEFGIEPSRALHELERAILEQDPALLADAPVAPERAILVVAERDTDPLITMGSMLARQPPRQLVIVQPIAPGDDLARIAAQLETRRGLVEAGGVPARAAAFPTTNPGRDAARFAGEQDVDLVLAPATEALLEDEATAALLDASPCDVAIVVPGRPGQGAVFVPFTGADHDWSAIEIGAWLARAQGVPMRLAGPKEADRDAGRALASASLVVQRVVGVAAEPLLLEPGDASLVAACADSFAVVVGLTDRWRQVGLGPTRSALARGASAPVLLVCRGLRPGGLAPPERMTRFTWTVAG
jgi:DNA-binding SARP family transcriptional activator